MPDYLLPCVCGQQTHVSIVQAGQSVRCVCGAPLQVPNLRELRELAPAEISARSAGRFHSRHAWGYRHRVAFLLLLGSLAAGALAIYLARRLPEVRVPATPQQVAQWLETSSPGETLALYHQMIQSELQPKRVVFAGEEERKLMLWGVGIALGASIGGLFLAFGVLWHGRRRKKTPAA